MKYGIKKFGVWHEPYWKENGVFKNKKLLSTNLFSYTDLDEDLFKDILKDELDILDGKITDKRIVKEFGYASTDNPTSEACLKQIVKYYRWRRSLFDKICKMLLSGGAETYLKKTGCDVLVFKYNIPAECNNFSLKEAPYTGGQIAAYIEISLYK